MKKLATLSLLAVGVIALSACAPTVREYDGTEVQGVTAEKILIGNTAATTGDFATVGQPFNVGLNAALWAYNNAGGFNGAQVELKHYDDGFDGAQGATYTKQLVEDDKVFALVGHFGTNTVAATVDYIKEQGVPMMYAATGINELYQEDAQGYNKAVMPVQPIYKTEGRVMLARAIAAQPHGFGATKVGVIYTSDDAGLGMVEGVRRQAEETSSAVTITYSETNATSGTNHASAVAKIAGSDIVIVCANQKPFGEILNYMRDGNVDKPVLTSYVSANTTTLGALAQAGSIAGNRQVFTNAWLDITSATNVYAPDATNVVGSFLWAGYKALAETIGFPGLYDYGVAGFTAEYWTIAETIAGYCLSGDQAANFFAYSFDSYALAGYCAGKMFVDGLARVETANKELTWLNYIEAVESTPLDVPMGGEIDYANGARLGIASLALNTFDTTTAQLASVAGITSLETIWGAVPANLKK